MFKYVLYDGGMRRLQSLPCIVYVEGRFIDMTGRPDGSFGDLEPL